MIGHLKKEQGVSYHLIFFSHFKDDDKSTDPSLNLSAISKQMHATASPPSPTTNTLIEDDDDDQIDREEQLVSDILFILFNFINHLSDDQTTSSIDGTITRSHQ